ncbi:MAG: alpha/beta fold hydrolase [Oscillochloridaceae bacterium]|nr:alpha/beta fold hydrolase [Chloroflexaceae bacterium]MDW8389916.1 alpha/beta fold hydrolase [Oscillochloridaceae bacterium]
MPQRPIVIVGGWLSSPGDYVRMARTLANPPYGRIVYITDFGRIAWASLRDPDFTPVLDVLAQTVELALAETGADRIDLIGHSAGGRIARAYLGHLPYNGKRYDGQRFVASLTTLGTAHTTYEVWVKNFASLINERYPGAFYPHISYRSVAGRSVRGRRFGTLEEIIAFRSYEVSFGNGHQIGDGIVPTDACYLEGADNIILEGARHAPYNAPHTWYGAPEVVPLWFEEVAVPA